MLPAQGYANSNSCVGEAEQCCQNEQTVFGETTSERVGRASNS